MKRESEDKQTNKSSTPENALLVKKSAHLEWKKGPEKTVVCLFVWQQ